MWRQQSNMFALAFQVGARARLREADPSISTWPDRATAGSHAVGWQNSIPTLARLRCYPLRFVVKTAQNRLNYDPTGRWHGGGNGKAGGSPTAEPAMRPSTLLGCRVPALHPAGPDALVCHPSRCGQASDSEAEGQAQGERLGELAQRVTSRYGRNTGAGQPHQPCIVFVAYPGGNLASKPLPASTHTTARYVSPAMAVVG